MTPCVMFWANHHPDCKTYPNSQDMSILCIAPFAPHFNLHFAIAHQMQHSCMIWLRNFNCVIPFSSKKLIYPPFKKWVHCLASINRYCEGVITYWHLYHYSLQNYIHICFKFSTKAHSSLWQSQLWWNKSWTDHFLQWLHSTHSQHWDKLESI